MPDIELLGRLARGAALPACESAEDAAPTAPPEVDAMHGARLDLAP
jgi:hypothetical protein